MTKQPRSYKNSGIRGISLFGTCPILGTPSNFTTRIFYLFKHGKKKRVTNTILLQEMYHFGHLSHFRDSTHQVIEQCER